MQKTVELLQNSILGIRLGNISPAVIDTVKISYYGSLTPIGHLATTQKSGNMICVSPYDTSLLGAICKALNEAGFSSYIFSKTAVAVSIPKPTVEEKHKIWKHLDKLGEEAKVAIRNIRKKRRQSSVVVDDKEIQKETDKHIDEINRIISKKKESI